MERMSNLSRDDYNALVREAQEFASAFGLEHRVRGEPIGEDGRIDAHFEVFFDRWRWLGHERYAMTSECQRWFDCEAKEQLFAEVSAACV